ncbi:MAG: glucan biosynthesis protein [Candidatus Contendobacter sp.]
MGITSSISRFALGLACVLAFGVDATAATTFDDLVREAFTRSQSAWEPPAPEPVAELDPPEGDSPLGLDFVEYGKLAGQNFFDDGVWWLRPSPRGNFEKDRLALWMYQPGRRNYAPVVYRETDFNYRDPAIEPPLPDPIPAAAGYLSAVDVGFRQTSPDGWPQILHLGGNGYGRLSGFPPLGFGTSFRLGVRNVGEVTEDFVKLRALYLLKLNERAFRLLGLLEGEAYAAAFAATLQPGEASTLRVAMTLFPRLPLRVAHEPSVGPLGLSSMFWKDERATPSETDDEAHDADLFVAWYPTGAQRRQPLAIPASPEDPPLVTAFGAATDFALVQSDRKLGHYRQYASADYANRASLLISDIQSSLPYTVVLWQSYTSYEGADNVAVFVRFNQDADPLASVEAGITFSYTLTAYR